MGTANSDDKKMNTYRIPPGKSFKYPRVSNMVTFEKINEDTVVATHDSYGKLAEMKPDFAEQLMKLDGKTDPATVFPEKSKTELRMLLYELKYSDLVRKERALIKDFPRAIIVTIGIPDNHDAKKRTFAKIWNYTLLFLCLPVLLLGIHIYNSIDRFDVELILMDDKRLLYIMFIVGFITGIIAGSFFHELGHACACMSYGGIVREYGIQVTFIVPGAYVMLDEKAVKGGFKHIQINAAGVESNLLIGGIAFCLSFISLPINVFMYAFGLSNVVTGLYNLCITNTLDGERIFENTMGFHSESSTILETAGKVLVNKKYRSELWNKGINGRATLVFSALVQGLRFLFPISVALDLVVIIKEIVF